MTSGKEDLLDQLLLEGPSIVRVFEAHSPISARLVEKTCLSQQAQGAHSLWVSSLTTSAIACSPDDESYPFQHRVNLVKEMRTQATSLPIVVDADTGGTLEEIAVKVTSLEEAGAQAIVIEDQLYPKVNSLKKSVQHKLESKERFAEKIKKATQIRKNKHFMIFARVESFIAGLGLEDALARAELYVKNQADGIVIHSKSDEPDDILNFAQHFRKKFSKVPLIAIPTTYHQISATRLYEEGFSMVIYANQLLRSSLQAMQHTLSQIIEYDRTSEIEDQLYSIKSLFKMIDETTK